jgi:hypothetical protein
MTTEAESQLGNRNRPGKKHWLLDNWLNHITRCNTASARCDHAKVLRNQYANMLVQDGSEPIVRVR